MPELRSREEVYEGQLTYDELKKIPFKDSKREKERLEKLEEDTQRRYGLPSLISVI